MARARENDSHRQPVLLSGTMNPVPFGPTQCLMSDLSDIETPVMLAFILNYTFRGANPPTPKAWAYFSGFIRMVDKAIWEYQAARSSLLEFCATRQRVSLYLQTVARLETCVGATKRAMNFLDRICTEVKNPGVPRDLRRNVKKLSASIARIRNAVEHIDEDIRKDRVADGAPVVLAVSDNGDSAAILDHRVSFSDLAKLLRDLNTLAVVFADYRETGTGDDLIVR